MFSFMDYVGQKFWPKPVKPADPFYVRLDKIEYDLLRVPELFLCPITLCIMENPLIVNSHRSHVFDEASLNMWLKQHPNQDPLRTTINYIRVKGIEKKDIKEDLTRKSQINKFVFSLEQIHALHKMLDNLEKTTVDILDDAFLQLDIAPEQRELLLKEQREEQEKQKQQILQIKLKLYVELDIFIKDTITVIESEDKMEAEKHAEINKITGEKQIFLHKLKDELEPIFPDIFSTRVEEKKNINDDLLFYFPSRSLFLGQMAFCEKRENLWRNTFFYSPNSAIHQPSMMVFAYLYALSLKYTALAKDILEKNQIWVSNKMTVLE